MFNLSFRSPRPIYEQITENYRRLITSGAISSGEKIPSVRELASQLAVNPNTIQKAYRELEAGGYICTVPGKGCYAGNADELRHKKVDMLFSQLDVLVLDFLSHGVTRDELKSHIDQVKEAS